LFNQTISALKQQDQSLATGYRVIEGKLEAKIHLLPEEVATEIARLKPTAMKVSIDELTPEMVEKRNS
jgi:adenosylhomocysteinase